MTNIQMPEPVRLRWNKWAGRYDISEDHRAAGDVDLVTTDQAEAYAAAKVREALEEAANKVADPVNIEATIENFGWVSHGNYVRAHLILRDAVEAIRALIPKD